MITPSSRPKASREAILAALEKQWVKDHPSEPFPDSGIGGIDAYYFRTMGDEDSGDRGIYDDAIVVWGPDVFAMFNANVNPSVFRPGIAQLLYGCHHYKFGNHGISRPGGGYPAMRPNTKDEALPVRRDGEARIPSHRPGIAINIHKGGYNTTSSEGCQTVYPSQWEAFYALASHVLKKRPFWYIFIPGPIN